MSHAPGVGQQSRRNAEAHHVGKRIELNTKLRIRARQARHAPIEGIEHNRQANGLCRMVEGVGLQNGCVQRGHASVVAAQQIADGKKARQQKNTPPQPRISNATTADGWFRR